MTRRANGNTVIVVPPTEEIDVILDKDNPPVGPDDPRWVPANRYIRTPWLQSTYAANHPITKAEIDSLIPLMSQRFNRRTRFMAKYSLHKESAEDEFRHFRQERDERLVQEKQVTYTPTPPTYYDPQTKDNADVLRDPGQYTDINEVGRVINQLREELKDPTNLETRREKLEIQLGLLSARRQLLTRSRSRL